MKANFTIPSGLLLEFSVAHREGLEVRWLDSYLTNDYFEPIHYQNLLSLVPRPGSGWVSPSQRPATQHSSGIGRGSGNAGRLAGRRHVTGSHINRFLGRTWCVVISGTEKTIRGCNIGVCVCVYARAYIYLYVCICKYQHVCMCVYICDCVCVCVGIMCICMYITDSVTPWTVTHQASLSMEFSRQKYWRGQPFPSPGDLSYPGITPGSPSLQADSLPSEPQGKPFIYMYYVYTYMCIYIYMNTQTIRLAITSSYHIWYVYMMFTYIIYM